MNWFKQIVARRRLYADLSEEIRQHLEEKIDNLVEAGMSRAEATAAARREFGNVTSLEERSRDVWRLMSLEDFLSDVGYTLHQLRRQPSFAVVAVLTLAVAIGANTAVFSVVNAVVLRPLPFADPDRLVSFQSLNTQRAPRPVSLSYPDFFDFRAANRVFERVASYRDSSFNLTASGQAHHVEAQIVSWDLFPLLGVQPALGRGFLSNEEEPGSRVVVLGYGLWQELFGADPDVVGRSITLSGEPYTVVGVAPPGFRFPVDRPSVQVWTTVAVDVTSWAQRGARMLSAIGRLRPGVTIEEAGAQMDVLASALAKQYPDDNANHTRVYVRPELERVIGNARQPLLVLMGAVALVLLIACANIANLLLARTAEREREFAVRASIGASRRRVIRQLLTEGFVLAVLGGMAGMLVAAASMHLLPAVLSDGVPRIQQVAIDRNVLLFTASVVLFTCVLFSTSPALQLAKVELVGQLKEGPRTIAPGRDRLRGALVVGQIALSLALVSGAALLVASLINSLQQDPGFRPENALKFSVSLPAQYDESRSIAFYDRLLGRLSNIPGVQSAAGGGPLPLTGNQMSIAFNVPGRPTSRADRPRANVAIVTPGYFRTLGIPVIKGRDFSQRDSADSPPVVIVNQAFADRFFPSEDPIGKSIHPGIVTRPEGPSIRQIVGIVGNAQQFALSPAATPIYYVPFQQVPWFIDAVVVRTAVPPVTVASTVRAHVASIDGQAAVHRVGTLDELQMAAIAIPGFLTLLLGSFAGMALLLAAVGLYGVVSHSVGRRTREIGVRMALGATRASVLAMVLRQAMVLVGAGLAIGFGAALAGSRLLANMLYGVEPHNPLLLAIACCAITLAGIVAAYFPAHRAASIEPMRALRAE